MKSLNDAGADAAGFDELLDAGIPHTHQRKFGRGKESVGRHQEQNDKTRSSTKATMDWLILTFQSVKRRPNPLYLIKSTLEAIPLARLAVLHHVKAL